MLELVQDPGGDTARFTGRGAAAVGRDAAVGAVPECLLGHLELIPKNVRPHLGTVGLLVHRPRDAGPQYVSTGETQLVGVVVRVALPDGRAHYLPALGPTESLVSRARRRRMAHRSLSQTQSRSVSSVLSRTSCTKGQLPA